MSTPDKRCGTCSEIKPLDEFYLDRRRPDGHASTCAACNRIANARWRAANPGYFTHWNRTRRIGTNLTREQLGQMLADQGGVCAICGSAETDPGRTNLALDHDHVTGITRGLLCRKCNTGLGLLGDDVDGLTRALAYLLRSQPSQTLTPHAAPNGSETSSPSSVMSSAEPSSDPAKKGTLT